MIMVAVCVVGLA